MIAKPPSWATPPVVLVADDDAVSRMFLTRILEQHGMRVETVDDGQAALARVALGGIDLVLLDAFMPRLGGFEACRILKANHTDRFLPVVLLTVRNDTGSRVEGLRIGADDYLGKPFDERELAARITALLRVKRMHDELSDAKNKLEELAIHDELTGLHNYRYLRSRVAEEFRRSERYKDPLACVMIDIDHFKAVNDTHGHTAGDAVLREVSNLMRRSVRDVDVVARYGGEEFLLLLPSTDHAGGILVAERVRRRAERAEVVVDGKTLRITVSAGVSSFPNPAIHDKDDLLKVADSALYRAKAEGRNKVSGQPLAQAV